MNSTSGAISLPPPSPYMQSHSSHMELKTEVRSSVSSGLLCINLVTQKGRQRVAQLILGISLVPMVALITQNAYILVNSRIRLDRAKTVKQRISHNIQVGTVVHDIQLERGISALYISSKRTEEMFHKLSDIRDKLDNDLEKVIAWDWSVSLDPADMNVTDLDFSSRTKFREGIEEFRRTLDNTNLTISQVLAFYSGVNEKLMDWMVVGILTSSSENLWAALVSFHMLIVAKEQAGVERALGGTFFTDGGFTSSQMTDYLTKKLLGKSYLERFQQYAEKDTLVDKLYEGSPLQNTIEDMRSTIVANAISRPDVEMGQQWFENMTLYINILKKTQDEIASNIVSGLDLEILQQQDELFVSVSIMAAAVLLLILVIFSVSRLTRRLQAFAVSLQEKTVALSIERKRSENLLNELLPPTVARKLMANEPVEPESFQAVTIFFSDIVGFTSISSKSSPMQVIAMLNMLYKTFDETLDMYNVYKVETIGDAYMVASGLPVRNEDGHAVEMAELSLEIRSTICDMSVPHLPDHALQIRIGLNSGSVVSGVVGNKMPRYCLFGDTVNVASRMESSGVPDKIQISGSTFAELSRRGGFQMEERGQVEIKGKGKMITYFLNGQTDHVRRRNVPPNLHT